MDIASFFRISYGIYAVCTADNGKLNGYIANTVFQVSADPPLLAISCSKDNLSTQMIKNSGKFSVSVLSENSSPELIGMFGFKSGMKEEKFRSFPFITGKLGTPILTKDIAAWFECEVVNQLELETHILIIGKVHDCEILDDTATPMTYAWYREFRKGLSPKNAPTYVDPTLKKEEAAAKVSTKRYQCIACNYIYDPAVGDPDSGIAPGTAFEDIPENWMCPVCGASKDMFEEIA